LYEIQKQTAAVCVASSCGEIKYHDLKNFSISEGKRICKLVNNHHHEFQTSTIQLTFEIKMNCEALKIKKKSAFNSKMPAKRDDKIQSSSVSEKNSTSAGKSKHWTGKLLEQHHVQMEAIQSSEQSQTQLMQ